MSDKSQAPIRSVTVRIYKETFTVHGRDIEKMKRVAEHVHDQMCDIASRVPEAGQYRLAILTALNLTSDLFDLQEDREGVQSGLELLDSASREALLMLDGPEHGEPPSTPLELVRDDQQPS